MLTEIDPLDMALKRAAASLRVEVATLTERAARADEVSSFPSSETAKVFLPYTETDGLAQVGPTQEAQQSGGYLDLIVGLRSSARPTTDSFTVSELGNQTTLGLPPASVKVRR
jgi:hypothetical protein